MEKEELIDLKNKVSNALNMQRSIKSLTYALEALKATNVEDNSDKYNPFTIRNLFEDGVLDHIPSKTIEGFIQACIFDAEEKKAQLEKEFSKL